MNLTIAWDRWIGNEDGEPVYYFQKKLASAFGWTLRLHKFVKADNLGCYHSHPAHAYRLVLWGGYVEELWCATEQTEKGFRWWHPGMAGHVAPAFIHRVSRLINERASWSLWLHGPKVADIELHGDGWPENMVPFGSAKRVRIMRSTE